MVTASSSSSPEDDAKREKLVGQVRTSVIIFWILSIVFLIIGITVLSMYHNLNDSSQYAGTIAGTFFLVFSIPLIVCSGFLTSALLIIQESIQDERDYRCRDPEFYKDIPYPRQPFKPVPTTSQLRTPYPSAPVPQFDHVSRSFRHHHQPPPPPPPPPPPIPYSISNPPSYHSAVGLND
ncbi:unnamed protein product [Schistosoma turkestanicum]|nr:unnamed protein product [Schistosoma turkestanicum]